MPARLSAAVLFSSLLCLGCPRETAAPSRDPARRSPAAAQRQAAPARAARLDVKWDPKTGRGDVRQHLSTGDILRVCFHCGYPGYTGGLVIGSYNGSGYGFYPDQPVRGFKMVNVFCAQDESIWDRDEKAEYTYGWSENLGKGDDGKRLSYVRGRIIEAGPDRAVLQSENAGGCYRVSKVAYTRRDVRFWIIATRIENTCARPVRFDFFSGDDPWLGLYSSAAGDVGWTPEGLVRFERAIPAGLFTEGGIYDLGDEAELKKGQGFSNQADFFAIDPATPLPDLALFANSFAHSASEVDPRRPLSSKSLRALNLAWLRRTLRPREGFVTAMALGMAETGAPGETPRTPKITEEDWSVWRRYLAEDDGSASEEVAFASELVELDLTPQQLTVTGTYYLRNPSTASQSLVIGYPIITSKDRPAPTEIELDGRRLPVTQASPDRAESQFPIALPPRGIARFRIRYTQPHRERRAAYLVTSARRWPSPLTRAVFIIRHPKEMRVRVSYPVSHREARGGLVWSWVVLQPFSPDRELELTF